GNVHSGYSSDAPVSHTCFRVLPSKLSNLFWRSALSPDDKTDSLQECSRSTLLELNYSIGTEELILQHGVCITHFFKWGIRVRCMLNSSRLASDVFVSDVAFHQSIA